jgi:hypothetical protein
MKENRKLQPAGCVLEGMRAAVFDKWGTLN